MTSRQLVPPIAFDNKVALTDNLAFGNEVARTDDSVIVGATRTSALPKANRHSLGLLLGGGQTPPPFGHLP